MIPETPETLAYLRECLSYNPGTGELTWRERPRHHFKNERDFKSWNTRFSGKSAGSVHPKGYLTVGLSPYGSIKAHRVCFALSHGCWPTGLVDHRDRQNAHNSIFNLREATRSQNRVNSKPRLDSVSGIKGVRQWSSGKWRASITVQKRWRHLGMFETKEEAIAAYNRAAKEVHGDFAALQGDG